ncbi:MAG: hypothetical protein IMX03_01215 [Brockia lithotrophica]|nr:hypothetical protein [Brockia lithotrophica]
MSEARDMINLDIRCAELGRELARISGVNEKLFNDALTVLEEQGPYAMFLYLKARHRKEAAPISKQSLEFLRRIFSGRLDQGNDNQAPEEEILNAVKELAKSLDDLLFARDLLRTAFSYARYFLKVEGGGAS